MASNVIGYALYLTCDTATASRIDAAACASLIASNLSRQGFTFSNPIRVQVNALSTLPGLTPSSICVVSMGINANALAAGQTRAVDAACIEGLKSSARAGWSVEQIRLSLPANGSATAVVSYTGTVTNVERVIRSDGIPSLNPSGAVQSSTVIASSDPLATIGAVNRGGISRAIESAGNAVSSARTPVIVAGVAVAAIAVAFIVYKVK